LALEHYVSDGYKTKFCGDRTEGKSLVLTNKKLFQRKSNFENAVTLKKETELKANL